MHYVHQVLRVAPRQRVPTTSVGTLGAAAQPRRAPHAPAATLAGTRRLAAATRTRCQTVNPVDYTSTLS